MVHTAACKSTDDQHNRGSESLWVDKGLNLPGCAERGKVPTDEKPGTLAPAMGTKSPGQCTSGGFNKSESLRVFSIK